MKGCFWLLFVFVAGCGDSTPPPKTEDSAKDTETTSKKTRSGSAPSVSQELGSIDQRAVEVTFNNLQGKLQGCHKQGLSRIEYLSGDLKVFLRVGQDGKVKYGFFEESTVGDRATEKCILDLFNATDWPKPQGGEAEVRNAFGFAPGGDRQPASWGPEKVMGALDGDKDVKKSVDSCKSGVSGSFKVTAYVEPSDSGDEEEKAPPSKGGKPGKGGGKPAAAKNDKKKEHGGKFKAIGVAAPGKEGAEKIDCIVDAMKPLSLPSPGSYAAKVSFTL